MCGLFNDEAKQETVAWGIRNLRKQTVSVQSSLKSHPLWATLYLHFLIVTFNYEKAG